MARVLVTGGAGFIGSHLAEALVAQGDQVRVFDNFSTGDPKNLAGLAGKVDLVQGDLRDPAAVRSAVNQIQIIFHQAAFVSVPQSMENPRECYETNVTGTIELLEVARQAGIRRVVLASSAAVYGANFDLPQSESAPPDCRSPYAASKQFNETLAKLYSLIFQIPVVALRYFNVYGPRQSPSSPYAAAIPRFVQQLQAGHPPQVFGDGSQTRDFVYVADAVRANLLAAQAPDAEGKVINVCSGIETKLLDLLEVLYRHFPNAPKAEFIDPRIGDVPRSLGNPNEAQKLLGFKAEVGLQEGLKNCVAALSA